MIVFGGGLSNEINDLNLLKEMTGNFSGSLNINTEFVKPMYGDASGVRVAARLGIQIKKLFQDQIIMQVNGVITLYHILD